MFDIEAYCTIADPAKIGQDTVGISTARGGERWLAGIVSRQEEQVLKLRRPKVEPGEAVVSLCILVSLFGALIAINVDRYLVLTM